jgi:uncharacterized membrane protein YbhN (UPF0104 family)
MIASNQVVLEPALRAPSARALMRRAAIPALLGSVAAGVALLTGARFHVIGDALRRAFHANVGSLVLAVVFECVSLAGYVGLLWLVAGRATPRVGPREGAQITLAGAGATRLLPTAGAGGAAVTIWTLRRAGLSTAAALRTLLVFFVLLYAFFLAATAGFGAALTFGLVGSHGPAALSATAGVIAVAGIGLALLVGLRAHGDPRRQQGRRWGRLRSGAGLIGAAVRDAIVLVRSRDLRLVGAIAYWTFDAAVLWATLSALGSTPPIPVLGLAYFLGQVANTLPLPGSVSGGITGVLIAWGVPAAVALPAVLAYRTIAVWLPTPAALAAIPGLRGTIARWARDDALAPHPETHPTACPEIVTG